MTRALAIRARPPSTAHTRRCQKKWRSLTAASAPPFSTAAAAIQRGGKYGMVTLAPGTAAVVSMTRSN